MRRRLIEAPNPQSHPKAERPLFGRKELVDGLGRAVRESQLTALLGAVGTGKSAVVDTLLLELTDVFSKISCMAIQKNDLCAGVIARAERLLDIVPGMLLEARSPELLVLEDAQNLEIDELHRLIHELRRSSSLHVLLVSRSNVPMRGLEDAFVLDLPKMDEGALRDFWLMLEEVHGPTPSGAMDAAVVGLPTPGRLRALYAEAAFGKDALLAANDSELDQFCLQLLSALDFPLGFDSLLALAPELELEGEAALAALVDRQIVEKNSDGAFSFVQTEKVAASKETSLVEEQRRALHGRISDGLEKWPAWIPDCTDRLLAQIRHLHGAKRFSDVCSLVSRGTKNVSGLGSIREILFLLLQLRRAEYETVIAELASFQGLVGLSLQNAGKTISVPTAKMHFCSGSIQEANNILKSLEGDASQAVLASALCAKIEMECVRGDLAAVKENVAKLANLDLGAMGRESKATAAIANAEASLLVLDSNGARQAVSRFQLDELDAPIRVKIMLVLGRAYVMEGRMQQAQEVFKNASQIVNDFDLGGHARYLAFQQAILLTELSVEMPTATAKLKWVVEQSRLVGDEVLALRAEAVLAHALINTGKHSLALETATAAHKGAIAIGLPKTAAEAELAIGLIEFAACRFDKFVSHVTSVANASGACSKTRGIATSHLRAHLKEECNDEELLSLPSLRTVHIADPTKAMVLAKDLCAKAEREGAGFVMAEALAIIARLQAARGEQNGALLSAERAIALAEKHGTLQPKVAGLLVSASIHRERGEQGKAEIQASTAEQIARENGLVILKVVASRAREILAASNDSSGTDSLGEFSAATHPELSEAGIESAGHMLSELGLMAARPYRIVSAEGDASFVADAGPELLGLNTRVLAIDGVREVVYRLGKQVADLRRRTLLKKLLFLFASNPTTVFSKETIVETVWEVEYHPLRHDAALFTNIMRIRRLLGDDGAELIRVSEEGYRFSPPKDFLYVEMIDKK